ncbi:MAG: TRAP transporter substrate-binding protein [Pseudomonadota bacterium]
MIDRRKLLGAATLGAAGLAAAACSDSASDGPAAPAVQRRKTRLTLTTAWPKDMPGLGIAAQRIATRIGELSEGQMEVQVYASGELVPAFEAFDAVASGNVDMYHAAESYWQSKSKAYNFFTAVPMGMTSAEIMGWIDFGGGQKLWEELAGQNGIIAFQAGNTGHQMGGWFRTEINSVDDFRGLKMRIPGMGGDVVRALGGAAEALPGNEVYQALQTGRIDATEWAGPWNDYFLGFHREAKYYYGPGFHEPGAAVALGINRSKWESLDATQQAIVRTACAEVNHLSVGEFTYQNAVYLDKLINEEDIELRTFPEDVMAVVKDISNQVRSDVGAQGGLEARIYESFEDALKKSRALARMGDRPYMNAREL